MTKNEIIQMLTDRVDHNRKMYADALTVDDDQHQTMWASYLVESISILRAATGQDETFTLEIQEQ